MVQKGLLNFFVANYILQPRVSKSVNTGRRSRGKNCFVSRGQQITGGYPKTITFLNIPGIQLVAKWNVRFIKKSASFDVRISVSNKRQV